MEINTTYSITQLFATKTIDFYLDGKYSFSINLPSVKTLITDKSFNRGYLFITSDLQTLKEDFKLQLNSTLDFVNILLFQWNCFKEYNTFIKDIKYTLKELVPELKINYNEKNISFGNINITQEIWDYFIYILKLSCGEKVSKPVTFNSEEEKRWYLAQQEMNAKINKVRKKGSKNEPDSDSLAKVFLYITYAFPSITIDYLYNQTLAQIHWLHKYAAGSVSYSINAQALAAGNTKKKQIDFFIK